MRLRAGFLRSRLDLAVLPPVCGAISSLPAERVPCGVRHELPDLTLAPRFAVHCLATPGEGRTWQHRESMRL